VWLADVRELDEAEIADLNNGFARAAGGKEIGVGVLHDVSTDL
jgi:hypothetical protein